jgi:subtilase family serine protease
MWATKGLKGTHVITITTDAPALIEELNEDNNVATLTVTVKDNRVTVVSFSDSGG